jgi:DNA invertase Pin-like site-specific DNA recombinase
MKRAILYARVSGDDRRGATSSIEAQLADCKRYCESRGYRIVGQAVEEPNKMTSGADWLSELERVISLAPTGTFDVLVCREVDRLARNRFKQLATEIELERQGVKVEYAVGQFEDTDEGRLLKGLVSEFAEYERGKIKRRTQSGKLRSVESGNVTVGGAAAPYGYDLVKHADPLTDKPQRRLEINPAEAAIVRQIVQRYVAGATLYVLCNWLDERGIRADDVEALVWGWIKSLLLEPDTLRRALDDYQQQQQDRVRPQLAMLESTQARLGECEGRKERLIAAYTTGVLSLDELATQKAALDKEIADLTAAIGALKADAEPQLLSAEQIADIETVAAEIRAGADAADEDPAAQREIYRLLRVAVTLGYDGDGRWVDVSCVLGSTTDSLTARNMIPPPTMP